jgi:hypothetical protein
VPEIECLPVGAAEGCDLLTFKKPDQKIAAFGSSYREARWGCDLFCLRKSWKASCNSRRAPALGVKSLL